MGVTLDSILVQHMEYYGQGAGIFWNKVTETNCIFNVSQPDDTHAGTIIFQHG